MAGEWQGRAELVVHLSLFRLSSSEQVRWAWVVVQERSKITTHDCSEERLQRLGGILKPYLVLEGGKGGRRPIGGEFTGWLVGITENAHIPS